MEDPSKITPPDGPTPAGDQETQTVEQSTNNKGFFTSLRRKISLADGRGRDCSVAESAGDGQLRDGPGGDDATVKLSSSHKRRSLVPAFMSPWKGKRPGSLPPAPTNSDPSATACSNQAACPVHHPSAASSVGHVLLSSPGAQQAPAQTTPFVSISPDVHPSFAALFEKTAMAEASRVKSAAPTSPRPPAQSQAGRDPAQALSISSEGSVHPKANCGHADCIAATETIREVHCMKRLFARTNTMDHGWTEASDWCLETAHLVLLKCEYEQIIARISNFATVLQQLGSPSNQGLLVRYQALLRLPNIQVTPLTVAPMPEVPASTPQAQPPYLRAAACMQVGGGKTQTQTVGGTPQPQYDMRPAGGVQVGGHAMQAGGCTPAGGYMPTGGYATVPTGRHATVPTVQHVASPTRQYIASPAGQHTASPSGQHVAASTAGQVTVPAAAGQVTVPAGQHTMVPSGQHIASPAVGQVTVPAGQHVAVPGTE